jgi:hypothetical protein
MFNEWANDNKPDATLEDFVTWFAGYNARQAEINSLHSEIERLQEVVAERIS